jgi:hypothetical protein
MNPGNYHADKAAWFGNTCYDISLYTRNHVGFLGGIVSPAFL